MHYGNIKHIDVANGEGVRVSLFVSGCRNYCKNCFNPETWNFDYGNEFSEEVQNQIIEDLKPSFINGLTILGGEPFEEENQFGLVDFIKKIKKELPNKTIWMYTGYNLENDLLKGRKNTSVTMEILNNIDILVDGKFIEELKNLALKFRGSSNQRIIDVKETLKQNKVILSSLNDYENFKVK